MSDDDLRARGNQLLKTAYSGSFFRHENPIETQGQRALAISDAIRGRAFPTGSTAFSTSSDD